MNTNLDLPEELFILLDDVSDLTKNICQTNDDDDFVELTRKAVEAVKKLIDDRLSTLPSVPETLVTFVVSYVMGNVLGAFGIMQKLDDEQLVKLMTKLKM